MKSWPVYLASLLAAGALSTAAPARAGTSIDVHLRVGDPYPGPSVVFRHEPDIVVVPGTRVYYVDDYDYDLYRYGRYWYFCDEGNWFRARTYRGPFVHIHYRSVPRAVYTVPVRYRKHWRQWPPGHAYGHYKKAYRRADMRHEIREERREGRREARRDDRRQARRDDWRDDRRDDRRDEGRRGR